MARTIPAAVATAIATDSFEVIIVLEVFWGGDVNGPSELYADRAISGTAVKGKILAVPPIDEAVQVAQGGQASSLRGIMLDDTEGDVKANFDVNDFQKVPVRVWLYIVGTDFDTEKVELFLGQVNSPIEWRDGERTFTFSITTRIEDAEVGFSAEEGNFASLPEELIGQPWPLCFGTTVNVPALKAIPAITGNLASGVGIKDFTIPNRIALAEKITCPTWPVGLKCTTLVTVNRYDADCYVAGEVDAKCEQSKCVELERLKLQLSEQEALEFQKITIFGGEFFPQGKKITLDIGGGKFYGYFDGTTPNPSNEFVILNRTHPDYDPLTGGLKKGAGQLEVESKCPGAVEDPSQDSDITESQYGPFYTGARSSRLSWEAYREAERANFFWAQGGASVTLDSTQEIIYIANILPSTIKRVSAWRTINGNQFLLTVPDDYYTIRQTNYGGYQVMEIVFDRPLSTRDRETGGGWSDDIFVSQVTTLSNNPVTILKWFITTYTNYAIDSTSFDDAETKLAKYPFDFPLTERMSIHRVLQWLAQRSRCALWLKSDTFYIKYLAEEPTPVATITQDDVLLDENTRLSTLQIELTKTEDLVTKLTALWQDDYALTKDKRLTLRHNISGQNGIKYGTHDRTEDYKCFAFLQLVKKSATFWLVRRCNTWKRLRFSVTLEFLKLEPFDAITVNMPDLSSNPIVCIVERATIDTANKQIDLEVWTPLRAGETEPHPFAWPATISANALFPTTEARNKNEAGSGVQPNFTTIAPPGHPLRVDLGNLYKGFSIACNGRAVTSFVTGECRQDFGDQYPSDIDDVKPTRDIPADSVENVSGNTSPISDDGNGYFSENKYLEDWNRKNENDGTKGHELITIINDDTGSFDKDFDPFEVDRDYLDSLPDPDDLDPDQYPCQARVTVSGFGTTQVGSVCLPQLPAHTEIYVFDSNQAAQDFIDTLTETSNCGSSPPCTQCVSSIQLTGACDEEDEGNGDLIAFRGAGSHPNYSFMQQAFE